MGSAKRWAAGAQAAGANQTPSADQLVAANQMVASQMAASQMAASQMMASQMATQQGGGAAANPAYTQQMAQQLAAELNAVGVGAPNDATEIAAGITKGGSSGMALASVFATALAGIAVSQQPGGPPLDPSAIDGLITSLPADQGPSTQLAGFFRSKLVQIKKNHPHP